MRHTDESWTLALDQGGHASRALVFADDGREVARAEVPVGTQYPRAGWVEHDPAAVLASISTCIRLIAEALGADVRRIGAAGLATQRSSLVCWSRNNGSALSPVLSWQDTRGAMLLDELALDEADIHKITGLRISPHYGASKMRWCLMELPTVGMAATRGDLAVGPLASWLIFALSGGRCFAADPCNASRTLLWDVRTRDWSPRLLDVFGVPPAILPRCQANRADWASLSIGDHLAPLVVVTGDQSAVPYAFETPVVGEAFLTLGTGAFLQQIEGATPTRCPGLLNSVIWQDGDSIQYALEGTVNGAGAALTWLAETEGVAEADIFSALPAWLETAIDPPLFINAIGGLAAPFWKSHARSEFVGASDLAGRAVAIIESIAFLVRANLDRMREDGRPMRKLTAVGGLARLDGLLERIAALVRVPVHRAEHAEATAYGVARLANKNLPPLGTDMRFEPDAALGMVLEGRYRRCLEKWQAL